MAAAMLRGARSRAFLAAFFLTSGLHGLAAASGHSLRAGDAAQRVSRELVERQLLAELKALLGHGASHDRLARFEELMRPMYASLPKAGDGRLDQGVARYALNRFFLTHHGWHIKGIAPDGERWNASSSTTMLKSSMPSFILELLEEQVGHQDVSLGELAVLAATVEDLVHGQAVGLLTKAYEIHGLSVDEPLHSQDEEDLVLETFMLYFLLPAAQTQLNTSEAIRMYLPHAHMGYPGWNHTKVWLGDVKESVKYQDRAEHNPFANNKVYFREFASMVHLVEQVMDAVGLYQDIECKELKSMLMELEDPDLNIGRVALDKFYAPFKAGINAFFSESPEYLRHLGAIDDSNPRRPSAIVPNYIYGRSVCLGTSDSFHSLCCVDQCNVLMESLERSVAQPTASPGLIAELVAAMPSDTVAAPRALPGSLLERLGGIAGQHGGRVPLHGRLFAQWMHHAYPNECPYPRTPQAAEAQLTHREWYHSTNSSPTASQDVMQHLADLAAADGAEEALPWTDEEALLAGAVPRGARAPPRGGEDGPLRTALLVLAMCGSTVSMGSILLESLRSSAQLRRQLRLKTWLRDFLAPSAAERPHFI